MDNMLSPEDEAELDKIGSAPQPAPEVPFLEVPSLDTYELVQIIRRKFFYERGAFRNRLFSLNIVVKIVEELISSSDTRIGINVDLVLARLM